ncbi:hypothetical protein VaNZ11_013842 [Volvox africanus]|uniref:von Hippel-Lindau disease tumour suppressor beta domain-containing protein n=1 Tax=Volvox africanus TaxID=51714 RepID=A0ABQ5SIA0_9CHLO|nr:hypothetical protein VaNZ11_013842 [Volvox africanus]
MSTRSTHEDGKTQACVLRIINRSNRRVKALWVGFNAEETCYMELEPGHGRPQQTYNTHVWRIRFADTDVLVGEYAGTSAVLQVQQNGTLNISSWSGVAPSPRPEWGTYCKRGEARGIEVWSYDCVDPRAVRVAEHIINCMLETSPPGIVRRLVAGGACVAIIGRDQCTTDIPAHTFLRWAEGGRDTDTTTRGLGGTAENPTTSCGEENLLMEDDRFYPSENILVHEFGHAVMNIGLTADDRAFIKQLYNHAYISEMYNKDSYIMENEEEYWAEGTQAWFDASIRTDVNSGVNTREKLRQRDHGLAIMMMRAYGDGPWRYPCDSPGAFRMRAPQTRHDDDAAAADSATSRPDSLENMATAVAVAANCTTGTIALSVPSVEETMERVRLAASWSGSGGRGPGWLGAIPGVCCLPGSRRGGAGTATAPGGVVAALVARSSSCGELVGFGAGQGPVLSGVLDGGCGTALWSALGGVLRSFTPHATVKMS